MIVPEAVISVAAMSPLTVSVVAIAGLVESVSVPATELNNNDSDHFVHQSNLNTSIDCFKTSLSTLFTSFLKTSNVGN